MKNNSLNEIKKVLLEAENICLFPHINADGDAIGSCVAFCKGLRSLEKNCYILMSEKVPEYLKFLVKDYVLYADDQDSKNLLKQDITAIWVDCCGIDRIPGREMYFNNAKKTVCIDHHMTSDYEADYNYIDPNAAATGELIYDILTELEVCIDKEIGEAIFTALTTDTGNFQYSNTRKKTFEIMVELMELDIDINSTSNLIYQNCPLEKIVINNKVLDTMEIFARGAAGICHVTQEMLRDANAEMEHTEGVINTLRSIAGVEIAAFLKEMDSEIIKVTMRAKSYGNVADICKKFSGGGHIKAAGCTLKMPMHEARKLMMKEISEALGEK